MSVYFVQRGHGGPVKIGWAQSIPSRVKSLQISSPETLILIRTINGSRAVERWAHHAFAKVRIRGEWFHYHKSMVTWVPVAPPPQTNMINGQRGDVFSIADLRDDLGMSRENFGSLFPVDAATIWRWERGRSKPNSQILLRRIRELKKAVRNGGPMTARKLLEQLDAQ